MIGVSFPHYEVVSKLGEGGMGEVYLARDTRLGRLVALKLLPSATAPDPSRRRRFLGEARAASALTHPNVCTIYEVGETEDERPYFAMEYVRGRTLAEAIRQERLPLVKVVGIAAQVADALDAAYELRIVHRDIKPSNISLTERGTVKVLDFGLAKRFGAEGGEGGEDETLDQTRSGQLVGTPSYMSPEQALGRAVDHRSDLFSLGVVLYELASGRRPFAGASYGDAIDRIVHRPPEPLRALAPELPAEFDRIVTKCLEKEPGRRYQTPRDLALDLQSLQRGLESGAVPAGGPLPPIPAGPAPLSSSQAASASAYTPGTPLPAAEATEDLERSDVLMSYAVADDLALGGRSTGWVTQFHRDLAVRLEQLSGEPVRIGRRPNPVGAVESDPRIQALLPGVKAMISVVSPPFVKSGACRQDVQVFWDNAERQGTPGVDARSRLLKVVKRPVDPEELAPPLSEVLPRVPGYDFYEIDPATGRLWEYDESFGPLARQRYYERVYDLARDVTQVLRSWRKPTDSQVVEAPAPPRGGKTVFLAETTADLRAERDKLRRELLERGHRVLPEQPLPLSGPELEAELRSVLARCDASVHLVGSRYGLIPEGATESMVEIQLRAANAVGVAAGLPRVVWMPAALEPADARQGEFVRRLQEDPAVHAGGDLLCGSVNLLKDQLLRRLDPPPKTNPGAPIAAPSGPPRVYLVCDPRDEELVAPVEDFLFDSGCDVSLPLFEGSSGEIAEAHRRNLMTCDAVLVFYGSPTSHWVEIKLMDLAQAPGYGRTRPFKAQAVLVPPSEDRRKNRFRTHLAEVIRPPAYPDPESLRPFVQLLESPEPRE